MRKELLVERERQIQHDLMQLIHGWVEHFDLDPSLLEIPLVRNFDTRRLLEQEALYAMLLQVDAKLREPAKVTPKRKAA